MVVPNIDIIMWNDAHLTSFIVSKLNRNKSEINELHSL